MENVHEDFARLHGVAQEGASGLNPTKAHPVFGAVHSMLLGKRYGNNPFAYMKHPGLRAMDTRQAALESLQRLPSNVIRAADRFAPNRTPTPPVYSAPMTPPGTPLP